MLQKNWFILVVLVQVILVVLNSLLQISSHTTVVNMNTFTVVIYNFIKILQSKGIN